MVNENFISLCSRAWALQILVYLAQGQEPRISPMAHRLSAGRSALGASLEHLIALGYLHRASGHGHPLRPAYSLSEKGEQVARWAIQLDAVLQNDDWAIARRAWTLPVLRLAEPSRRFGEFRTLLAPVTDRALSQTLKMLAGNNWLQRDVLGDTLPPEVRYSPRGTGELLIPCLQQSFSL